MAVICPTITTDDPHVYREQMERVQVFAKRVHIDVADGVLTPNSLIDPAKLWWPEGLLADIHIMFVKPQDIQEHLLSLKPHMLVVHAEAQTDFLSLAEQCHHSGVKLGLALLQDSRVSKIAPILPDVDHVLIFSGSLGRFGGVADLSLLDKITELRQLKPSLEIGWDGGINDGNVASLVARGVDVLNTGGFIHRAADPAAAFLQLNKLIHTTV